VGSKLLSDYFGEKRGGCLNAEGEKKRRGDSGETISIARGRKGRQLFCSGENRYTREKRWTKERKGRLSMAQAPSQERPPIHLSKTTRGGKRFRAADILTTPRTVLRLKEKKEPLSYHFYYL